MAETQFARRERFAAVGDGLNERSRRLLAAAEAKTAGYGGIAAASKATGIARSTIGRGLKDLADPGSLSGKVRRPGSGCTGCFPHQQTWRGKPLTSRQTAVELIRTGLTVRCELDTRSYPKGIKVTDAEIVTLNIKGDVPSGMELYDLAQTTALKRASP